MKKITLITMQLKTPGGIERFVTTLATILTSDFEVEFIVNYGKPTDQLAFPLPKNIKITFLSPTQPNEVSMKNLIIKFHWHKIPSELKRRHQINSTQQKVFRKCLKSLQTDFIITDRALYSQLVNRHYHGKAIKIATDHNFHQNNRKYIKELINSLQNFNALVVATEELKNFYQNKISPIPCYSIPNPISIIPTKKSNLTTKNLLAIGRLVPEKDFSTIIEVMHHIHNQNPNIHLTIIGDGPERSALQTKIQKLHLEQCITMTGWLSQNQITKHYYDSSLFIMTSKTEAFGLVLTEAMSYGLPCVAFARASGARTQINATNGALIDSSNPIIMAKTIVTLLNHPKTLKKFQSYINKDIQRYSSQSVKKAWVQLLSKMS